MLTVKEVAERLGADPANIRMWIKRGRFKGARREESPAGPYWLIPPAAVDEFEKNRRPVGRPKKNKLSKA